MKIHDFAPTDENIFMNIVYGSIKIYDITNQPQTIYCSRDTYPAYVFDNVSFSHDKQYVLIVQNYYSVEDEQLNCELSIISYQNIISHNWDEGYVFRFSTDIEILDLKISPNNNQVAIIFTTERNYTDTIHGLTSTINDQNKYFLHVYDFNVLPVRLVFNKIFDNPDQILETAFCRLNNLAVVRNNHDHSDVPGEILNEIAIYDITTGNILMNTFVEYNVKLLQYYPNTDPNYNKLIFITSNIDNSEKYIKILELDMNSRDISVESRQIIDYNVNSIDITHDGQICLGTDKGLYYFSSLHADPIIKFQNMTINNIIYSRNGERIAFNYLKYEEDDEPNTGLIIYSFLDDDIIFHIRYEFENLDYDPLISIKPDPELNECVVPPADPIKLLQEKDNNCFDILDTGLDIKIGTYLSADVDNLVVFYKQSSQPDFFAVCLTFTALKYYLKDPKSIYYKCEDNISLHMYCNIAPEYLKIPAPTNIYVNYNDMKKKYRQRQNMIFIETDGQRDVIEKTVSYDVSYTMNAVSGWHCQKGTSINVYHIIF